MYFIYSQLKDISVRISVELFIRDFLCCGTNAVQTGKGFHAWVLSRILKLLVQPLFISDPGKYSFSLSRVVNYLNKVRQLQHGAKAEDRESEHILLIKVLG